MEQDAAKYSRVELCQVLGVSRSGWYHHQAKANSARRKEDEMLSQEIKRIFHESRRTYGWRRIAQMLAREGIRCGKERILRLLKRQALRPIQKRCGRPKTTHSRHDQPVAINRLKGPESLSGKPNEVWCGDITYIPTLEQGWLYLAGNWMIRWGSELVIGAFRRAVKLWQVTPQIHHSDRGVQYASSDFRRLLESHGVSASMSAKGNCYDNAAMESFWATLKTECFQDQIPRNREHAQTLLFDYIETFYNPKRLHSSLGYQSPLEFEQAYRREQTQAA